MGDGGFECGSSGWSRFRECVNRGSGRGGNIEQHAQGKGEEFLENKKVKISAFVKTLHRTDCTPTTLRHQL